MEERPLNVVEFNEQLKQWNGQSIRIVKEELDDLDETLLDLQSISYTKGASIDDYIPRYSLLLRGIGIVGTTMNNYEELPSQAFEIPLEEEAIYEFDGTRFFISTSRGVYMIEQYDW